jgi:hypothetical protein
VCKVKEKKFEARLKELETILNNDENAWLFEQLLEKSKWTLAFDEGGPRYRIMTTNILKVFNFCSKSYPFFASFWYRGLHFSQV